MRPPGAASHRTGNPIVVEIRIVLAKSAMYIRMTDRDCHHRRFSMLRSKVGRVGLGIAALAVAAALIVPAAFGHAAAAPKLIGNAKAGKSAFATTCAACHTLKAAGAVGTIGP